jgi:fumarylacetoacetate (FAA) hydrolase
MKLVTIADGTRDGRLHLASRDNQRIAPADNIRTMQDALDHWDSVSSALEEQYADLNAGKLRNDFAFDPILAMAPLPRAWQWLDGSAFASHGELMRQVFGVKERETSSRPLMYQGLSHRFLGPREDVPLPSQEDGIDFEGEFGVIVGDVAMGTTKAAAAKSIRLIVLINDWSLRHIAPIEMATGFGWLQCKPACSVAPIAVTPDELGTHWRDSRVDLPLNVSWNGQEFGRASGYEMAFGFDDLIVHAASTRDLPAGTVVGSGTVSNSNFRDVGSSCIAERRGIEIIDQGAPSTPFMAFGDTVQMSAALPNGFDVFGRIDQAVTRAGQPTQALRG